MRRLRSPLMCVYVVAVLQGCGGGSSASDPVIAQPPVIDDTPTALLTNAKTEAEVLATFEPLMSLPLMARSGRKVRQMRL